MKKQFQVVAGIIVDGNKILCGKRGKGYFEADWEFPGGKIENGETKEDALARELEEEIGIQIDDCRFYNTAVVEYDEFVVNLYTYLVKYNGETLTVNVHQELKWITLEELFNYNWCDTDYQIIESILQNGGIEKLMSEW